jgi:hypothetical protein
VAEITYTGILLEFLIGVSLEIHWNFREWEMEFQKVLNMHLCMELRYGYECPHVSKFHLKFQCVFSQRPLTTQADWNEESWKRGQKSANWNEEP